jgi:hypothetical protein
MGMFLVKQKGSDSEHPPRAQQKNLLASVVCGGPQLQAKKAHGCVVGMGP